MELLYYKVSRAGEVHKHEQHAAITILSRMIPRPIVPLSAVAGAVKPVAPEAAAEEDAASALPAADT